MTAESDGGPNRNNVSMLTAVREEVVPKEIDGGERHEKRLRPADDKSFKTVSATRCAVGICYRLLPRPRVRVLTWPLGE